MHDIKAKPESNRGKMIVHDARLFENNKFFSLLSKAGYSPTVIGPQLLGEIKQIGKKEFTVYINTTAENVIKTLENYECFEIHTDSEPIMVEENTLTAKYVYEIVPIPGACHASPGEFLFALTHRIPVSAYHVGYQHPGGIICEQNYFEIMNNGVYEIFDNYPEVASAYPDIIVRMLEDIANYPLFTLSDKSVQMIVEHGNLAEKISNSHKKRLVKLLLGKRPDLLETMRNLNLLNWIFPEISGCFNMKNDSLSSSYKNYGEACINSTSGLSPDIALAILSIASAGVFGQPSSYEETEEYLDNVSKAVVFAGTYAPEDVSLNIVVKLIDLLARPLPIDEDNIKKYIVDNFDTVFDMAHFIAAYSSYSNIFIDSINKKNIDNIGKIANYGRLTRRSWDRDYIDISDEEIVSLVGEDEKYNVLKYIRSVLIDNPAANFNENIRDMIVGSNLFEIIHQNFTFDDNNAFEMRKRQKLLVEKVLSFDADKIHLIRAMTGNTSPEEEKYLEDYILANEQLDAINQLIIESGIATDEEKVFLEDCHAIHEQSRKENTQRAEGPIEFWDTDTAFFEHLKALSLKAL